MHLHNTLTRKLEEFVPLKQGEVGVYICGPTVYDFAHIGHARTYVNSDVLVRSLRMGGYQVKVVMNITDVGHLTSDADSGEDKLEKKAREAKQNVWQVADFYTQDFWAMTAPLNIGKPDVVCKATDHIKEMITLVKRLEEKGFTYITDDGVYFDTSKLKDYGKLARLDMAGLQEGARVEKNLAKKNPTDFALWKFAGKGEQRQMEWDSPWGKHSYPGWHIECSAMSMKYLGESFDIHTGGVDHIPVHHTNEIAQAEAVSGKPFVKYWFHSAHLLVEGQKMSKSLKNFFRVADVEAKGFDALALRYLFLTAHYRTEMNFTWKALEGAQAAYAKLRDAVGRLKTRSDASAQLLTDKAQKYAREFSRAVGADLAIPEALAVMWEAVKSDLRATEKLGLLEEFDKVLGLGLTELKIENAKLKITEEVKKLVKQREELRRVKQWAEADKVRGEIEKLGYRVEDREEGVKLVWDKKGSSRRL